MPKQIKDLKPGDSIHNTIFVVSEVEHVVKNNFHFIALLLSDCTGKCKASFMDYSSENYFTLCQARLIKVQGEVQTEKKYRGQIKIIHFMESDLPEDLTPFIEPLKDNHEDVKSRFCRLMETITEPNLRKLLQRLFDPSRNIWPDFCTAVAAERMHHSYRGGLLEHSLEVAEMADAICGVKPLLDRNLLVTCALLHDIGKLEEMEHGLDRGAYTASGVLIGHVTSGAYLVRRCMQGIKDFPHLLIEAVTHMILSHQGTLEFGTVRLPAFAEAQVLSECDMMSARLFQYAEAAGADSGSLSVWLPGKKDGRAYVGDLGLQKTSAPSSPPLPVRTFSTEKEPKVAAVQSFTTIHMQIRGMVAAGAPEQSSEEEQETREVTIPNNGADYLLRVTGDSMVDAGIFPDDFLFVKSQETANHSEIVIANLAGHGDVVKRLRRDKQANGGLGQDWLDSENRSSNYQPILADEHTRYQGVVVGLLKGA